MKRALTLLLVTALSLGAGLFGGCRLSSGFDGKIVAPANAVYVVGVLETLREGKIDFAIEMLETLPPRFRPSRAAAR
jgi:hypothetical protein